MSTTTLEVADIFRAYGEAYRQKVGWLAQQDERVMRAIVQCRTAELGGHLYACEQCGVMTERYNSCRNRHCPKCQFLEKARWLEKRVAELLPTTYFHVVFTIPHEINPLVMRNDAKLYNMLFRAVAETLQQIAADPKHLGARVGSLAVLHTWGNKLQLHPHIHLIVPAGGLSPAGDRWISCPRDDFLLPVKVLGAKLRGKLLDFIDQAGEHDELRFPETFDPKRNRSGYQDWKNQLYDKSWCVYAKRPFGGPEQGLKYLARYTYRVAISNDRLLHVEDDRVHFRYKDNDDGCRWKTTSLEGVEFVRRYLMHVLPPRFHRIRYYGLFANRWRAVNLERCRTLLGVSLPETDEASAGAGEEEPQPWEEQLRRLTGIDPTLCRVCKVGRLVCVESLPRQPAAVPPSRAPPSTTTAN